MNISKPRLAGKPLLLILLLLCACNTKKIKKDNNLMKDHEKIEEGYEFFTIKSESFDKIRTLCNRTNIKNKAIRLKLVDDIINIASVVDDSLKVEETKKVFSEEGCSKEKILNFIKGGADYEDYDFENLIELCYFCIQYSSILPKEKRYCLSWGVHASYDFFWNTKSIDDLLEYELKDVVYTQRYALGAFEYEHIYIIKTNHVKAIIKDLEEFMKTPKYNNVYNQYFYQMLMTCRDGENYLGIIIDES